MRDANGFKRAHEPQPGENIQPALVNSAIAGALDKMPEGNHAEIIEATRQHGQAIINAGAGARLGHEVRRWEQEYKRRARAMPFVRFVAKGEPLPLEIGNVDKLEALDGSGIWYLFPTTENLNRSYGGSPGDPELGQEAQGGPLHGETGRGEKYIDAVVETEAAATEETDTASETEESEDADEDGIDAALDAELGGDMATDDAVTDPAPLVNDATSVTVPEPKKAKRAKKAKKAPVAK